MSGRVARRSPNDAGRHVAPEILGVPIGRPGKILWPAEGLNKPIDKLTLGRYFKTVGYWILPYVAGRPCSILRAPDGISGPRFPQRNAVPGTHPLFDRIGVNTEARPLLQIGRFAALVALAQEGALELHTWNCRPHRPAVPGRLVFDLDPGPGVTVSAVVRAAWELKERLDRLGLTAFCKTSGGKGLHLVVPLDAPVEELTWAEARNFSRDLCAMMAEAGAGRYTVAAKDSRRDRIFLNWLGNDQGGMTLSLLSPRAQPGALVSMPLDWSDVTVDLDPTRYTVRTAPALLIERTPWAAYDSSRGSLRGALKRLAET